MTEIKDKDIYLSRMEKSVSDKMFFIDKISKPIDTILDYGCANGALLSVMHNLYPDYNYIVQSSWWYHLELGLFLLLSFAFQYESFYF